MYSDLKPINLPGLNLVAAAGTSLFKAALPAGHREITVRAITQVVTTSAGASTSGCVKLLNGTTVVKSCSGVGISAAAGTTTYDEVADGTSGQRFKAGDTLDLQVDTTCTTTGTFHVILWID